MEAWFLICARRGGALAGVLVRQPGSPVLPPVEGETFGTFCFEPSEAAKARSKAQALIGAQAEAGRAFLHVEGETEEALLRQVAQAFPLTDNEAVAPSERWKVV